MSICIQRENWVLRSFQSIPWPKLPPLYNVGPLGEPQPFRTRHGEWGPPMGRISEIDWELYSFALICSDVLLSLAWHLFATHTLRHLRIRWLSPTFRVSIGYVFGTMRLSLVIYFFRARPLAAYTYLHAISFALHCSMGLIALVFGDGPMGHLRPNEFGLFERDHQLNPYAALPVLINGVSSRIEYWFWGSLQSLIQLYRNRPSLAGYLQLRLVPASSLVDSGLEKIARIQNTLTNTFSPPASPTRTQIIDRDSDSKNRRKNLSQSLPLKLLTVRTSGNQPDASTLQEKYEKRNRPHRIVCDPIEVDGEIVELNGPEELAAATKTKRNPLTDTVETSPTNRNSANGTPGSMFFSPPLLPLQSSIAIPSLDIERKSENEGWSRQEDFRNNSGEVVLAGPANFKLRVSQVKWNASILFWAKPSLEAYFGQHVKLSSPSEPKKSKRFRTPYSPLQEVHILKKSHQIPLRTSREEKNGQLSPKEKSNAAKLSSLKSSSPPNLMEDMANRKDSSSASIAAGNSKLSTSAPGMSRKSRSASLPNSFSPSTSSRSRLQGKRKRRNTTREGLVSFFDEGEDPLPPRRTSKSSSPNGVGSGSNSQSTSSWSALESFVNRSVELSDSESEDSEPELELEPFISKQLFGVPIRGTVSIRGDGILLSISPSPPNIREIRKTAERSVSQPPETREVIVELIGRSVYCKSGRRTHYLYAEYRPFGMSLSQRQQSTLLSLLNKLNGDAGVRVLRTYREKSILCQCPSASALGT